jgi:glycosidase
MNRFLFIAQGDKRRLKLAAACQFTLSQPPIVLYGTEVGLSQHADCRSDLDVVRERMPWGDEQDAELHAFYRRLCSVRQGYPPLRRGARQTLHVDADALVYRKGEGEGACIVALHKGEGNRTIRLGRGTASAPLHDALGTAECTCHDGAIEIGLGPWQAAIFVPTQEG